ncbi:FAD-dependent monooxygenase [Streptomyces sp. NBC_00963]|uniref:FAD-dependent oxidoreductase n=1 Tax=Streptomyces sp. NBC_00963 TaxID=2903697 RepID=UPI00386CA847|nr:FAD-dependent monooxygenase [Streptomyces sp. NBC_00963]
MAEQSVVIAGGGIGGLALGIALRRGGIPVTVIERTAALRDAGAGLVLYPNALHALAEIDTSLASAVRAAGHVPEADEVRPIVNTRGVVVTTDRVGELARKFGAPQVSLLRTALQSLLLRYACEAGVRMRRGTSVTGCTDLGDRVEVGLSDGNTATAAALIGADGLHSVVRRYLLGVEPPRYCGYTTLRGRSPAPALFPNGFIVTADGIGVFAAPTGSGRLYWTAKVAAPAGVWPAKSPEEAWADLLTLLSGWHPALVDVVRCTDPDAPVVVTDINDREPVADWSRGRVSLLGDAAHPMSPGAGQGAGMALEDAAVLGGLLSRTANIPDALRSYVRHRAPRTAVVVNQSRHRDHVVRDERGEFSTHDTELTDLFGWRADFGQATE